MANVDTRLAEESHLEPVAQIASRSRESAQAPLRDCWKTRVLSDAGHYERSAPLLIDDEHATDRARKMLSGYYAVLRQSYTERLALYLPDARVAGQGAVVTCSGALIAESVASFTAHGLVPTGLVGLDTGAFAMPRATRRINRPCLLAKRPWYRNYGHWLVDCATVIAIASAQGISDGLSVVIGPYQHPGMEKIVRHTIEEFAWRSEVLTHPDDEIWEFDMLCYFSPLHVAPLFKLPASLRALRSRLLTPPSERGTRGRRLFVSRGSRSARQLLNENELLGLCVKSGFELVYPERLSLTEQAALFQSANTVVGVKGAALTNAMFMSRGAAAIVLSPADFPDPFFWDICGQLGVAYLEIFGTATASANPGHADFSIDPGKLHAALTLVSADD